MKIGLIQTQGIGDIIIGLPIAKWFADRGHQVFWPVNKFYADYFALVAPYVRFLPVRPIQGQTLMGFCYEIPLEMLNAAGCDKIYILNMDLADERTLNGRLAGSLKFDEYKYAVAKVPFSEKWNLSIERDRGRELALHQTLDLKGKEYVCVHFTGSGVTREVKLPQSWLEKYRIVTIDGRSDNPFDWIYTIENAAKRVMIDSMFSNLTDQLNICGNNYLVQRSVTALTPVYKNGWQFYWPDDTIEDSQIDPR